MSRNERLGTLGSIGAVGLVAPSDMSGAHSQRERQERRAPPTGARSIANGMRGMRRAAARITPPAPPRSAP
ncbi:hypothetical protein [Burkholderia thailandensis]|uniref:hypothetical protein n=1 Tax=Burkholderia thailandensis TaxID=57975 RepID=UPI00016A988F|nr:hypothetical protein [Burkholderia thailandensis]AOJ48609.1 hypothetical protein WJ27_26485 [Burkholderia thailandensis]AVR07914.1 hypothetical protein A8H31_10970 [Burkholderia thailandensis]AWY60739.1 hypothetical protein A8H35_20575 [Burkholderia thailandensis]AWY64790.1 hypothetical protein A8H36_05625 [Burkholderia thailandensis]KVG17297.1 hypothetical protein WJ25_20465 [Burkholderia thailandensis]